MEPKLTETLPIYRKTLEVCHLILKITNNFPKRLQDNLGKRMYISYKSKFSPKYVTKKILC